MEGGERGADQKGSWEERRRDAIERVVVPGCSGRPCSMHLFLPPVCMCAHIRVKTGDFPGGSVVKNPPANVRDTDSIPDLGRSHVPWSH